ncbi:ABC transporter ATP-binding protein [Parvularcula dongshanensis]|uniref:Subfamily B ATP-binding cassette protein MsbA n=1 Tax=Parvularcula dongshanensis TaxID=1173995 RepID=A0A840I5M0_9PROT|nr:ABC transporter ATP-binding protein [Parvularcula dongshanensis]MBB4660097.1 subfamily B ATP-binding cassette protein MsbA [Parvularcula dongshanensis]
MIGLAVAEAGLLGVTQWVFAGLDAEREAGTFGAAGPRTVMVWGPVFLLVLGVLQAVLFYAQAVLTQGAAVGTLRDLQHAMFARIGTLDLAQVTGEGAGPLVSRFTNDMTVLREGLTRAPNGLRDAIRLAVVTAYLAWLDPVLFVAVLLVYPTVGLPVAWLGGRVRRVARRVQAQIGDMTGLLTESLRGQRMVKTYGLERRESARLGQAFDERASLLMRLVRLRAANEPIITVVGAVAFAVIVGVAAFRIGQGDLTGAELVTFLIGMALLSQPARGLGTLNAVLQEGMGALERVLGVLDLEGTIRDRAGAQPLRLDGPPTLSFRDVTFAYQGEPALRGFSLDVPAGATVALVGPSGAGKSTVFALVPRLFEPQGGEILIAGQEVRSVRLASLRAAVALVGQDAVLFDESVAENIGYGRLEATDAQVREAARAAAAEGFVTNLPRGYDTKVGDAGASLSGGQRARIALARAFLKDAPLLLLDEPTAALDAESERLIEEALARLSKGRTTLVIAHRLSTVRDADLIAVVDEGRVVEQGTHDELLAQGGLYARLARLQLREEAPA